jgi:hypothetical protein
MLQVLRNTAWLRKQSSKILRESIKEGNAKPESRFYIKLPGPNEHANHIVGEVIIKTSAYLLSLFRFSAKGQLCLYLCAKST